jgi:hypothetical protein
MGSTTMPAAELAVSAKPTASDLLSTLVATIGATFKAMLGASRSAAAKSRQGFAGRDGVELEGEADAEFVTSLRKNPALYRNPKLPTAATNPILPVRKILRPWLDCPERLRGERSVKSARELGSLSTVAGANAAVD